ncbi:hypothetical protein C8J55DRAFT_493455 [Lentinula edodes]|uniref:Uncharacterized protein n=1 Tax=Lentinula lateritia TaxID=40482 RepID=A0A9W8ZTN8_9AGAR|nr:hypothetical protein C8J55DRAFT_493455 [Lentinula edodes]
MPADHGSHGPPSADFTDKDMVSESPQDIKAIQCQNDKETLLEIRRQIAKNAFPTGQLDLQHVLEILKLSKSEIQVEVDEGGTVFKADKGSLRNSPYLTRMIESAEQETRK